MRGENAAGYDSGKPHEAGGTRRLCWTDLESYLGRFFDAQLSSRGQELFLDSCKVSRIKASIRSAQRVCKQVHVSIRSLIFAVRAALDVSARTPSQHVHRRKYVWISSIWNLNLRRPTGIHVANVQRVVSCFQNPWNKCYECGTCNAMLALVLVHHQTPC